MKKFKYLLSALVVALVLTCVANAPTAVKAADLTNSVDYANQIIKVTSDAQVYYQIVKSTDVTDVKAAAWLPATKVVDGETTYYYIDLSALSKGAVFAITTDNTTDKATQKVTVASVYSGIKATLDCRVEGANVKNLYSVLYSITVTKADKSTVDYVKDDATNGTAAKLDALVATTLQWKRGANGAWANAGAKDTTSSDFVNAYSMMRSSNSTIYVRATASSLPSKETKIKVAKTAAGPTVKVDYAKGTIALKNGMDFYVVNGKYDSANKKSVDSDQIYVAVYDKSSAVEEIFATGASARSVKTKTKASTVDVSKIATLLEDVKKWNGSAEVDAFPAGTEVTLMVRTTASEKKYASWYTKVTFKLPADTKATDFTNKEYVYDAYNKKLTLNLTTDKTDAVEYVIVKTGSGNEPDESKLKWTKVVDNTKATDLSKLIGKDIKYKNTAGNDVTVKYEDIANVEIWYRWASNVDKTDASKNKFAANVVQVAGDDVKKAATQNVKFVVDSNDTKVAVKYGKDAVPSTGIDVTKGSKVKVSVTVTPATGYSVEKLEVKVDSGSYTTVTGSKGKYEYEYELPAAAAANVEITFKATYKQNGSN